MLEAVTLALRLVEGIEAPIVFTEGLLAPMVLTEDMFAPIVADIVAPTVALMILTDLELLVGNLILFLGFAPRERDSAGL